VVVAVDRAAVRAEAARAAVAVDRAAARDVAVAMAGEAEIVRVAISSRT
jgi:hypothetical protein